MTKNKTMGGVSTAAGNGPPKNSRETAQPQQRSGSQDSGTLTGSPKMSTIGLRWGAAFSAITGATVPETASRIFLPSSTSASITAHRPQSRTTGVSDKRQHCPSPPHKRNKSSKKKIVHPCILSPSQQQKMTQLPHAVRPATYRGQWTPSCPPRAWVATPWRQPQRSTTRA